MIPTPLQNPNKTTPIEVDYTTQVNSTDVKLKGKIPSVLFVPEWVQRVATRHNLTLEQLFNKENFFKYFSPEDQVLIVNMQYHLNRLFEVIRRRKSKFSTDVNNATKLTLSELRILIVGDTYTEETNRLFDFAEQLCMTEEHLERILARLGTDSHEDGTPSPLSVVHVNRDVIALVIPVGQNVVAGDKTLSKSFHNRAVEAVLRALYVYLPQAEVNASVWFKYHVRLLAQQQQA